jgi:hypothetical protein
LNESLRPDKKKRLLQKPRKIIMRTTLLILCAFIPTIIFAQDSATISGSDVPAVYDDGLIPFLDSLKIRLLADTTKFKRTDLIFTTIGLRQKAQGSITEE